MRRAPVAMLLFLAACQASPQPSRAVLLDIPFEEGRWAMTLQDDAAVGMLAEALLDRRLERETFIVRAAVPAGRDPAAALTLSRLRAAAVVDALVDRGVPRERLSYDGLGTDAAGERVEVIAR